MVPRDGGQLVHDVTPDMAKSTRNSSALDECADRYEARARRTGEGSGGRSSRAWVGGLVGW
jgi:hypothetical protein